MIGYQKQKHDDVWDGSQMYGRKISFKLLFVIEYWPVNMSTGHMHMQVVFAELKRLLGLIMIRRLELA